MRFDDWWDFDAEPRDGGQQHDHTQKVPTGTHTGDIVKAYVNDFDFKQSDDNPAGKCLVVLWSKQGFHPVESIVSVRWQGLIQAICRAAGVALPQRGEDWDEKSLVGRVATIDVETAVSGKGKEYQRVTKWHASPQKPLPGAPQPKRAAKRTPAAKAHAEFQERAGDDDIPF